MLRKKKRTTCVCAQCERKKSITVEVMKVLKCIFYSGSWDRVKLVRLSPVLTSSCDGSICVLVFDKVYQWFLDWTAEEVYFCCVRCMKTLKHNCPFVTRLLLPLSFLLVLLLLWLLLLIVVVVILLNIFAFAYCKLY